MDEREIPTVGREFRENGGSAGNRCMDPRIREDGKGCVSFCVFSDSRAFCDLCGERVNDVATSRNLKQPQDPSSNLMHLQATSRILTHPQESSRTLKTLSRTLYRKNHIIFLSFL